MKNLLAIETSTQACSVAVARDKEIIAQQFLIDRQAHSQQLLVMIQSSLTEANLSIKEIDAIVCSIGPGTFTGVRIGVGVAKGLAYGQDIPIIPVSSLSATGLTALDESASDLFQNENYIDGKHILVINDARMSELYSARYQLTDDQLKSLGDEFLMSVKELTFDKPTLIVGTGIEEYRSELEGCDNVLIARTTNGAIIAYPKASAMLKGVLAKRIDFNLTTAEALRPNYLRNKVV